MPDAIPRAPVQTGRGAAVSGGSIPDQDLAVAGRTEMRPTMDDRMADSWTGRR
jgi:hypothetical protein